MHLTHLLSCLAAEQLILWSKGGQHKREAGVGSCIQMT